MPTEAHAQGKSGVEVEMAAGQIMAMTTWAKRRKVAIGFNVTEPLATLSQAGGTPPEGAETT